MSLSWVLSLIDISINNICKEENKNKLTFAILLIVMFWPFDPAKNAIQGGAPEGSDTSRSLEIGRGCAGVEACLYYCVGVWK